MLVRLGEQLSPSGLSGQRTGSRGEGLSLHRDGSGQRAEVVVATRRATTGGVACTVCSHRSLSISLGLVANMLSGLVGMLYQLMASHSLEERRDPVNFVLVAPVGTSNGLRDSPSNGSGAQ